ncbi:hypothetical protein GCM10022219_06870 [Microbacterium oryzae]|uniref:CU044_5270 family protein n=1 Tax=Microbacterium oryzae TaxID=743009 RepID=A0A6I6DXR4_9MICO|nr:hypothetical protein [Microbacterium oryzae]QGU26784.1 hypothetical protein D7D94_03215 [Microbacterium oryzae]
MDVLEQVRDMNPDATSVSEADINSARQRLLREIATVDRVGVRARRRWFAATALVGGVATAAVAVGVLAPAQVDPAAAAVLEDAADVTITAVDTTLAPGQYLRIEETSESLLRWDADMGDDAGMRFNNANRADAEAGLVVQDTRALYVPADRAGDWVWDASADQRVTTSYGDRADEATADWEANAAESSGYWPDIQVLPGGEYPAAEGDTHEYLLDQYRPYYNEMPRDPHALLEWYRADSGDSEVSDQWVVDAMADTLAANLMPADLRAATLRALALVPGITLEEAEGNHASLEYRSGNWLNTRLTQVTLDTSTGMITSLAQTSTSKIGGNGILPDSVPDTRTLVKTTVVDEAPGL